MINSEEVSGYLKRAHAIATISGKQPDMSTLRGRTEAKDTYASSGLDQGEGEVSDKEDR